MRQIKKSAVLCILCMGMAILAYPWLPALSSMQDEEKLRRIESMYRAYKEEFFPEVKDLSVEQAVSLMENDSAVFVDVRTDEEQAISMLPGGIPYRTFLADPEAYSGRIPVGYCTISYRSGKLAVHLAGKGIHMVNLRGGILAWIHKGEHVFRGGRPVQRVHVYGKRWDLAPGTYETVRKPFWGQWLDTLGDDF